jgi:hypothetical protein
MDSHDDRRSRLQQVNHWFLSVAGGIFVWYFASLYVMAGTEMLISIPSVWLLGELVMPRKAEQ